MSTRATSTFGECNALAAVLAVVAFKKKFGFYRDEEHELHSLYAIDRNYLANRYGESADEGR